MSQGEVKRRSGGRGAETARRARTRRYRAIVGSVPQVIVVIDPVGQLLDVSEGVTERLGYDPDELVGRSVFDFLHPGDHQQAALEMIRELEPDSQAESITCRLRHTDQRWVEFEILGSNRLSDPAIGGLVVSLRDVSARRLGDRVLAAGDYLYSSLATVASDGTTIFDGNGRRVYVSASLGAMLGYTHAELLSIAPSGLVHVDDMPLWKQATADARRTENGTARTEVRLLRSDGSPVWIEATVVNLLQDSGVHGVVVHARDIDDRRKMEEALRIQATRDPLTGLANRYALMDELEHLATVNSDDSGGALLFCDLDGFKAVNDTYGHAAGDRMLIDVARRVVEAVRPSDFVARIGGDEFCILCRDVESPAEAHALAARVRDALATPQGCQVGVSIGAAWIPPGRIDADLLLTAADRAMYRAKHRGSNLIEIAEPVAAEV